jgi:hypothetical protein
MKIDVRKESFKVTNPLIRFDGHKRIRLITVKKDVKTKRIFVR